jgi:transketolase
MLELSLIPRHVFRRIRSAPIESHIRLALIADMCRANTLMTVKRAGSGHLGSSFSSLDIVTFLYYSEMNTSTSDPNHPDRDIYFSSKGHDVPGLYAVLYSLGILPEGQFLKLRRLGGTCGHPDVRIPGIEANSGSLGMGISKGKGMALGKRLRRAGGRVFVMTGDGELQEGQIYEALQTASHQGVSNLHVIVDHNKIQSDKPVEEIVGLGNLEDKFRSFGWHVLRCDGHDFKKLQEALTHTREMTDKPKIIIADTVKGRGVSFMEHPQALKSNEGLYPWHAGAPDDRSFQRAYDEILSRITALMKRFGLVLFELQRIPPEKKTGSCVSEEYVADAFGRALVDLGAEHENLVVLDADLSADCRLRSFEKAYPDRFIENGIAEQDMVSTAGGLALQGFLPVVNSFGAFLASRANEQIYANAAEGKKIIYIFHYAGLIPAGPGHSHQSIRDISLVGALPGCIVIQPCNGSEARAALTYCVKEAEQIWVLRLNIGPSPTAIQLPEQYSFNPGQGAVLRDGSDAVLITYGPVLLHEALLASRILNKQGFTLKVVNMPWLNRSDPSWIERELSDSRVLYTLDDHAPFGGIGDTILNAMAEGGCLGDSKFVKLSVQGYPTCGTPREALHYHGLDGESIARRIWQDRSVSPKSIPVSPRTQQ